MRSGRRPAACAPSGGVSGRHRCVSAPGGVRRAGRRRSRAHPQPTRGRSPRSGGPAPAATSRRGDGCVSTRPDRTPPAAPAHARRRAGACGSSRRARVRDEEVGTLELGERIGGVAPVEHCVAQLRRELAEHRDAVQKGAVVVVERREDLGAQVVGDEALVTAERGHRARWVVEGCSQSRRGRALRASLPCARPGRRFARRSARSRLDPRAARRLG